MCKQGGENISSETPDTEVEWLGAQKADLFALTEPLHHRVPAFDPRLNKQRHNSNKSPSSDSPFNKSPLRSQRKPQGRKTGAQKGHKGAMFGSAADPESRTVVPLSGAYGCRHCCADVAAKALPELRSASIITQRQGPTQRSRHEHFFAVRHFA